MAHFAGANTLNFGGATPTGNFVPEIYSQKVLNFFRRKSVVEGITNSDYYGEISSFGDTVNVIKEPTITISDFLTGDTVTPQALTDDQITLVLDQAKAFSFRVDDIEAKISHVNWTSLATDSAAYSLKNDYDQKVLTFMADETGILAANVVNDTAFANLTDLTAADDLLNAMSALGTKLTKQDVPEEGRWIVLPPEAMEVLAKADSKLLNMDYNGGVSDLRNGLVSTGTLRGFQVYMTNNAPQFDTTGTVETHHVMMAGHMSACATANAIVNTESYRSHDTFADVVRGLHVYGRAIVRPEGLAINHATFTGVSL
jgi:hypothetical protein